MSTISIAYTTQDASATYNVSFQLFSDGSLPRTYLDSGGLENTVKGGIYYSGSMYPNKRVWAISSVLTDAQAQTLDTLYRAWDADRAEGYATVVGILDDTFGDSVDTDATITTPPTFSKFGVGHWTISIGLTEV